MASATNAGACDPPAFSKNAKPCERRSSLTAGKSARTRAGVSGGRRLSRASSRVRWHEGTSSRVSHGMIASSSSANRFSFPEALEG